MTTTSSAPTGTDRDADDVRPDDLFRSPETR